MIPTPRFVVKTQDELGRKVFINVCGSEKIAAPGSWKGGKMPESVKEQLERMQEDGDGDDEEPEVPNEGLRFPLSASEARSEFDKKGVPSTVFDVVFNEDIVKQAMAFRRLKVFLVDMCLGWVGQKAGLNLDPKYKLPRRSYLGDRVLPQRIRVDRKALITEVDEVEEEPSFALRAPNAYAKQREASKRAERMKAAAAATAASAASAPTSSGSASAAVASDATPAASAPPPAPGTPAAPAPPPPAAVGKLPTPKYEVKFEGKPWTTHAVVTVQMPEGVGANEAHVAAALEVVTIGLPERAELRVKLPFFVDGHQAEARVVPEFAGGKSRNLVVRLPYKPYADVIAEHTAAQERQAAAAASLELLSDDLDID